MPTVQVQVFWGNDVLYYTGIFTDILDEGQLAVQKNGYII
jgi:hypothetical protein